MNPITSTKAALVDESTQLRAAILQEIADLQRNSARFATRTKSLAIVAASSLALFAGFTLLARRQPSGKTSQHGGLVAAPLLGLGLVAGICIATRSPFRRSLVGPRCPTPLSDSGSA